MSAVRARQRPPENGNKSKAYASRPFFLRAINSHKQPLTDHKQLACRQDSPLTWRILDRGFAMASKRQRGDAWEFTIKRAKVLPRAVVITFRSEAEGDAWCRRVEYALDAGIIPPELLDRDSKEKI